MEKLKGFVNISKGKFNTRKEVMTRLKGSYCDQT